MSKKSRARVFNGMISYSYYLGGLEKGAKKMTEEEWMKSQRDYFKRIFEDEKTLNSLAFIFHDKDLYTETDKAVMEGKAKAGEVKPLHMHFIVEYENPRRKSAVEKTFMISRSANLQITEDKTASYRYLIHVNDRAIDEGKTMYHTTDVVCLGGVEYKDLIKTRKGAKEPLKALTRSSVELICDDLINGRMRLSEVPDRLNSYLGDRMSEGEIAKVISNNLKHFETAQNAYIDKREEQEMRNRDLTFIYITGASGTGKSVLGKNMAEKKADALGSFIMSGGDGGITHDLLGSFRGERSAVFNDVKARNLDYNAFLTVFDPYQLSYIPSRYKNKKFTANYALFANAEPVGVFIKELKGRSEEYMNRRREDMEIMRRIPFFIEMVNGIINVYVKAEIHGSYYLLASMPYTVDELLERDEKYSEMIWGAIDEYKYSSASSRERLVSVKHMVSVL